MGPNFWARPGPSPWAHFNFLPLKNWKVQPTYTQIFIFEDQDAFLTLKRSIKLEIIVFSSFWFIRSILILLKNYHSTAQLR